MQGQTVRIVSQTIRYIEEHLHEKMDLDIVASALHYFKYHLHRIGYSLASGCYIGRVFLPKLK